MRVTLGISLPNLCRSYFNEIFTLGKYDITFLYFTFLYFDKSGEAVSFVA